MQYQLEILPEPGQPPVASGKGMATLEDHSVFLRTQINLQGLKTGKYYIAFRQTRFRVDSSASELEIGSKLRGTDHSNPEVSSFGNFPRPCGYASTGLLYAAPLLTGNPR